MVAWKLHVVSNTFRQHSENCTASAGENAACWRMPFEEASGPPSISLLSATWQWEAKTSTCFGHSPCSLASHCEPSLVRAMICKPSTRMCWYTALPPAEIQCMKTQAESRILKIDHINNMLSHQRKTCHASWEIQIASKLLSSLTADLTTEPHLLHLW